MTDVDSYIGYAVGENIDSLLRIDLRGYRVPQMMYEAARALTDRPLVTDAANRLADAVGPGDTVFLLTGFISPPWDRGEHDGLAGTVILARALEMALGARPVVIIENELVPVMRRMLANGSLVTYDTYEEAARRTHTAWVTDFPLDADEASAKADALVTLCKPKAAVAIERPGANSKGEYHFVGGENVSKYIAKTDVIFTSMHQAGLVTIGIGDNGNELGMGAIAASIEQQNPAGSRCKCPCGGGIAAAVGADAIITAAASDWGAYGLAAALAYLSSKPQALATAEVLERLLWVAIDSGVIDGSRGYAVTNIDDVYKGYHLRLIDILHDIVDHALLARTKYTGRIKWAMDNCAIRGR